MLQPGVMISNGCFLTALLTVLFFASPRPALAQIRPVIGDEYRCSLPVSSPAVLALDVTTGAATVLRPFLNETSHAVEYPVEPAPLTVKGIVYAPAPVGSRDDAPPYGDWYTFEHESFWRVDVPRMASIGVNVVRVMRWADDDDAAVVDAHAGFLDLLYDHGMYVLLPFELHPAKLNLPRPSLGYPEVRREIVDRFSALARNYGMHPAVLGFLIDNEADAGNRYGNEPDLLFAATNDLATALRRVENDTMVAIQARCPSSNTSRCGHLISLPLTEDGFLPFVKAYGSHTVLDAWSFQPVSAAARVNELLAAYDAIMNVSVIAGNVTRYRPALVTLTGTAAVKGSLVRASTGNSSSVNESSPNDAAGEDQANLRLVANETHQAEYLRSMAGVVYGRPPTERAALGMVVMEWTDEWWRGASNTLPSRFCDRPDDAAAFFDCGRLIDTQQGIVYSEKKLGLCAYHLQTTDGDGLRINLDDPDDGHSSADGYPALRTPDLDCREAFTAVCAFYNGSRCNSRRITGRARPEASPTSVLVYLLAPFACLVLTVLIVAAAAAVRRAQRAVSRRRLRTALLAAQSRPQSRSNPLVTAVTIGGPPQSVADINNLVARGRHHRGTADDDVFPHHLAWLLDSLSREACRAFGPADSTQVQVVLELVRSLTVGASVAVTRPHAPPATVMQSDHDPFTVGPAAAGAATIAHAPSISCTYGTCSAQMAESGAATAQGLEDRTASREKHQSTRSGNLTGSERYLPAIFAAIDTLHRSTFATGGLLARATKPSPAAADSPARQIVEIVSAHDTTPSLVILTADDSPARQMLEIVLYYSVRLEHHAIGHAVEFVTQNYLAMRETLLPGDKGQATTASDTARDAAWNKLSDRIHAAIQRAALLTGHTMPGTIEDWAFAVDSSEPVSPAGRSLKDHWALVYTQDEARRFHAVSQGLASLPAAPFTDLLRPTAIDTDRRCIVFPPREELAVLAQRPSGVKHAGKVAIDLIRGVQALQNAGLAHGGIGPSSIGCYSSSHSAASGNAPSPASGHPGSSKTQPQKQQQQEQLVGSTPSSPRWGVLVTEECDEINHTRQVADVAALGIVLGVLGRAGNDAAVRQTLDRVSAALQAYPPANLDRSVLFVRDELLIDDDLVTSDRTVKTAHPLPSNLPTSRHGSHLGDSHKTPTALGVAAFLGAYSWLIRFLVWLWLYVYSSQRLLYGKAVCPAATVRQIAEADSSVAIAIYVLLSLRAAALRRGIETIACLLHLIVYTAATIRLRAWSDVLDEDVPPSWRLRVDGRFAGVDWTRGHAHTPLVQAWAAAPMASLHLGTSLVYLLGVLTWFVTKDLIRVWKSLGLRHDSLTGASSDDPSAAGAVRPVWRLLAVALHFVNWFLLVAPILLLTDFTNRAEGALGRYVPVAIAAAFLLVTSCLTTVVWRIALSTSRTARRVIQSGVGPPMATAALALLSFYLFFCEILVPAVTWPRCTALVAVAQPACHVGRVCSVASLVLLSMVAVFLAVRGWTLAAALIFSISASGPSDVKSTSDVTRWTAPTARRRLLAACLPHLAASDGKKQAAAARVASAVFDALRREQMLSSAELSKLNHWIEPSTTTAHEHDRADEHFHPRNQHADAALAAFFASLHDLAEFRKAAAISLAGVAPEAKMSTVATMPTLTVVVRHASRCLVAHTASSVGCDDAQRVTPTWVRFAAAQWPEEWAELVQSLRDAETIPHSTTCNELLETFHRYAVRPPSRLGDSARAVVRAVFDWCSRRDVTLTRTVESLREARRALACLAQIEAEAADPVSCALDPESVRRTTARLAHSKLETLVSTDLHLSLSVDTDEGQIDVLAQLASLMATGGSSLGEPDVAECAVVLTATVLGTNDTAVATQVIVESVRRSAAELCKQTTAAPVDVQASVVDEVATVVGFASEVHFVLRLQWHASAACFDLSLHRLRAPMSAQTSDAVGRFARGEHVLLLRTGDVLAPGSGFKLPALLLRAEITRDIATLLSLRTACPDVTLTAELNAHSWLAGDSPEVVTYLAAAHAALPTRASTAVDSDAAAVVLLSPAAARSAGPDAALRTCLVARPTWFTVLRMPIASQATLTSALWRRAYDACSVMRSGITLGIHEHLPWAARLNASASSRGAAFAADAVMSTAIRLYAWGLLLLYLSLPRLESPEPNEEIANPQEAAAANFTAERLHAIALLMVWVTHLALSFLVPSVIHAFVTRGLLAGLLHLVRFSVPALLQSISELETAAAAFWCSLLMKASVWRQANSQSVAAGIEADPMATDLAFAKHAFTQFWRAWDLFIVCTWFGIETYRDLAMTSDAYWLRTSVLWLTVIALFVAPFVFQSPPNAFDVAKAGSRLFKWLVRGNRTTSQSAIPPSTRHFLAAPTALPPSYAAWYGAWIAHTAGLLPAGKRSRLSAARRGMALVILAFYRETPPLCLAVTYVSEAMAPTMIMASVIAIQAALFRTFLRGPQRQHMSRILTVAIAVFIAVALGIMLSAQEPLGYSPFTAVLLAAYGWRVLAVCAAVVGAAFARTQQQLVRSLRVLAVLELPVAFLAAGMAYAVAWFASRPLRGMLAAWNTSARYAHECRRADEARFSRSATW
jgi:hypothetical protein